MEEGMTAIHLMCETFPSNEYGETQLAVLLLDEALATSLLGKIRAAKALKESDEDFYEMRCWAFGDVELFEYDFTWLEDQGHDDGLSGWTEILPDDVPGLKPLRQEVVLLNVREDSIDWIVRIKHESYSHDTPALTEEDLEAFLAGDRERWRV
jgi:hypothetical protein